MEQISIFDESERLTKLSKLGDNLEKLNSVINWEMFRTIINNALAGDKKSNVGRPPFDYILLFKIIVLQKIYNLSDDAAEYQINDRLSFMRFLGLGISSNIPDSKTIWKFKNDLKNANVMKELFNLFNALLEEKHIITHEGTIVDATFVDVPRQRNTRKENAAIKEGKVPEEWINEGNLHKYSQKDTDARWAKKGNETHYGYKDLVKADADSKIVTDYIVTSASVHDSQEFLKLLNESDKKIYADSAFKSKKIDDEIPENIENLIHEKGYRDHPLTEIQKESNKLKSKIRCRIEHIFGFMTNSMNGIFIRSIGIKSAEFQIGLGNLVYNLCRYAFLQKSKK